MRAADRVVKCSRRLPARRRLPLHRRPIVDRRQSPILRPLPSALSTPIAPRISATRGSELPPRAPKASPPSPPQYPHQPVGASIDVLGLSGFTRNALVRRGGISSVEQLVASSVTELLTIRMLGATSLREIVDVLRARGYELRR
jgi:hypothetical protein